MCTFLRVCSVAVISSHNQFLGVADALERGRRKSSDTQPSRNKTVKWLPPEKECLQMSLRISAVPVWLLPPSLHLCQRLQSSPLVLTGIRRFTVSSNGIFSCVGCTLLIMLTPLSTVGHNLCQCRNHLQQRLGAREFPQVVRLKLGCGVYASAAMHPKVA